MATIPTKKYRSELIEANKKLHEHIWSEVGNDLKSESKIISTSTSDLVNSTDSSHSNGLNELRKLLRQNGNDNMKKTKTLIDDNIDLRIK